MTEGNGLARYWSLPPAELFRLLQTSPAGLASTDAAEGLRTYGPNSLGKASEASVWRMLADQFRSPLVLILVGAAIVSALVAEWVDATIVVLVVIGSAVLGFWQEYRASAAVSALRARVSVKCSVVRDGAAATIPAEDVVPGDIVTLTAGSLVPADGVVLEAKDCFVTQSALTGESFPVEKFGEPAPAAAPLAERTNCLYMGTSVRSGTARMLVVTTGTATVFGGIADRLRLRPPETEFERGLMHFGYLLTQVMLLLVLAVFAINVFLSKPPIESFLFAIALAVGLSPELLPAVITVTLSNGARAMAARGVIVRRLNSIENFGSMDILCSDKTGTLTEGVIRLDRAVGPDGAPSPRVLELAALNAALESGLANALDEAIRARVAPPEGWAKLDEIPYDFVRKRMSVAVSGPRGEKLLVVKGALEPLLDVCTVADRQPVLDLYAGWGREGFRVLGVASKPLAGGPVNRLEEADLTFEGFLLFFDAPKADARASLAELAALGVELKVITGDNRHVTRHVAEEVGLSGESILTGEDVDQMRDEALWHVAPRTSLFVEVDPNQKERIIGALRKAGHVVGYLGDGINDATALHAADVGISVDTAVDVAREAADFVLLEHDLGVLKEGILQGRRTFANTIKYVFTTTSANFGNMFSMAGASLFLPFLPLLAKQILLNNFLADIPNMAIAGDNVDEDWLRRPRRWDVHFLRDFMVVFGLVSSIFDYLTFGALLLVFGAGPEEFRTAWFIESLLTQLAVALVVRTRRPFYRSRPGTVLLVPTVIVAAFALALPYLPYSNLMGFVPMPPTLVAVVITLVGCYVLTAEITKYFFYRRWPLAG